MVIYSIFSSILPISFIGEGKWRTLGKIPTINWFPPPIKLTATI